MLNPYEQLESSNDDNLLGDDLDFDEVQQLVDEQIVRHQLPQVRKLDEFFNNARFAVEKGDARMNLWEQGGKFRKICLNKEDVPIAFALIDEARKNKVKGNWTEKQQSGFVSASASGSTNASGSIPACIMIDVDIYQKEDHSKLNEKQISKLQNELCNLFRKRFRPMVPGDVIVYSDVRRKPAVKFDDKKQMYKDGFQLFIFARLTRDEKRFFIHEILRERIFSKVFKEYENPESFLDTQCCHVPTLLYGSCKQDSVPKYLWLVYQWHIEEDGSCIIQTDPYFAQSGHRLNMCLELSCNFEGRVIKKLQWTPLDEYTSEIALMSRKARDTSEEDRTALIDEINNLSVNDPDADYIKSVLDCLKPERYNNHKLKFNVVYALVKNNERYIPLAKLFLKKSHKYTDAKFAAILESVWKSEYALNLESIYHWASKDSPDKFKACNDRSCFVLMSKFIFDPISDGKLGHAHYAEIAWMFLKNKYKTDIRGTKKVWFEFKFPQDPHERGQVYKWCEVQSPDSLSMYLHRKMSLLCEKMVKYISKKVKDATDKVIDAMTKKVDATHEKALKTYYSAILRNFKGSARGLWADGFKAGILKQSESIFNSPGFIKSLDTGLMDLGVGNGILQLSWEGKLPKLIKSYNTNKVSRFTSTPYKVFDPKDPITRKLLRGFRSMHPDSETDAYEYLMSSMAASIDNRTRETLLFMITGLGANGKSCRFEQHAATLEELYCTTMPIALLLQGKESSGEAPKPFLMKLETARSAYYEEGPACAILDMPMVKRVTGCGNLPARGLFENARSIKSRCYHYILSNHDFIVLSHEEAVWRRLRRCDQKITFKSEREFDASNPNHRLMDRSFNQEFMYEEHTRSAYLSILTFQHMKLMKYFGGVVENVPHPTIDKDTLEFRNRQDTLNRFITERVVISPCQETPTPLERAVEIYCQWYDANVRGTKHFKQDIFKQMQDSSLKEIIEFTPFGSFIQKGYRVMEDAEIQEDETSFSTDKKHKFQNKAYSMEFKPETPDEYLDRVEREWAELMNYEKIKAINLAGTYDYDSDDPDCEDGDIDTGKQEYKDDIVVVAEPSNDAIEFVDDDIKQDSKDEDICNVKSSIDSSSIDDLAAYIL